MTKIFSKIPDSLQGVLWSKSVKELDLKKDKVYIIHQVLSYGSLKQIKWLFKVYPSEEIRRVFLKYPKKIYTPPVFYFVKDFILVISKKLLKEKYVKTPFGASK